MFPELIPWLNQIVGTLTQRIRTLEAQERAELAGGVRRVMFASLPTAGQRGRILYVIDGRKVGELAGAGTGVCAYDDSVAWRRFSDDTTVAN